jgi:FecR protein/Glucodextranase, domain B
VNGDGTASGAHVRQSLTLVLVAMLVLIGGFVAYRLIFAPDPIDGLQVVEVSGKVSRTNAAGAENQAGVGDLVAAHEQVRVDGEGYAVLAVGDATRLTLDASSSLKVLEVDERGVRVELQGGRVSARVRPGSSVDVSARGRSVSARDADFAISAGPEGSVAVETTRGEVGLSGFDTLSRAEAGQQVWALPDRTAVIGAIPSALLLEVNWPSGAPTRSPELPVEGHTDPYAIVQIRRGDETLRVRAAADGSFRATMPVQPGENNIEVEAEDLNGRKAKTTGTMVREQPPPPVTNAEVQWGG